MLIKLKTLIVENEGYKRSAKTQHIYINSNNIVSVSDYPGIADFLITEKMHFSDDKFSLIKISLGTNVEDVIAFGTSATIYSQISEQTSGKRLLND
tara:strand:+ start:143 stop:430 length:288 start_codon:yes stop_codon:yes gene_type:complete